MTPAPRTAVALWTAAASWVLYVWSAPGTVGWYDAPELTAAAAGLGIAHAPGEPAYLLLVRSAQLLPVGDLASRAVWFSATCAAVVVALTVLLAGELLPRGRGAVAGAVTAGLLAAASGALWTQAVVVELYALAAAAVLAAAWLAVRGLRGGGWGVLGLLISGGALVNPLVTALALPGIAVLLLPRRRRPDAAGLAWLLAGAAVGAAGVVYLPLRSAAEPPVWMAVVDGPGALFDVLSGRVYARSYTASGGVDWGRGLAVHGALMAGWIGVPAMLLGAAGIAAVIRRRPAAGAGLLAIGMVTAAATLSRPVLEEFTPDVAGYLVLAQIPFLIGAGWMVGRLWSWTPAGGAALAAGLAVLAALHGVSTVQGHRGGAQGGVAAALLEAVPPGGVVAGGSDSTSLALLYATTVEHRRPDLLVLSVYGATPEQLRRAAARHPQAAVPVGVLERAVPAEQRLWDMVRANRSLGVCGTPLLWPPAVEDALVDVGLGTCVARDPGDAAALGRRDEVITAEIVAPLWRRERLARDRQLRRLLAATASTRAGRAMRRGESAAALDLLRTASALHPDPTSMVHLQRAMAESGTFRPPPPYGEGTAAARGLAALREHRFDEAVAALSAAVAHAPEDATLGCALATALFWSGDVPGAGRAWDRVLELVPGHPEALAGKERLYSMGLP